MKDKKIMNISREELDLVSGGYNIPIDKRYAPSSSEWAKYIKEQAERSKKKKTASIPERV